MLDRLFDNIPIVTAANFVAGEDFCHGYIDVDMILRDFTSNEYEEWEIWDSQMREDYEYNYEYFSKIEEDMTEVGFGRPVLLDLDILSLMNGHHRVWIAKQIGLRQVAFVAGNHPFTVDCEHFQNCRRWDGELNGWHYGS